MKGTVKWFNATKNFGFILGEDGEDYFVHGSQVPDDMRLKETAEVEFNVKKTDKGNQAVNLEYSD